MEGGANDKRDARVQQANEKLKFEEMELERITLAIQAGGKKAAEEMQKAFAEMPSIGGPRSTNIADRTGRTGGH